MMWYDFIVLVIFPVLLPAAIVYGIGWLVFALIDFIKEYTPLVYKAATWKGMNMDYKQKALDALESASNITGEDPATLVRVAHAYIELGEYDKAEDALKAAEDTTGVSGYVLVKVSYAWRELEYAKSGDEPLSAPDFS